MREDKKANKRKFNYKKGREAKITHFWSPNKIANREERKKREEEEDEGQAKKKGMHFYDFWYGF